MYKLVVRTLKTIIIMSFRYSGAEFIFRKFVPNTTNILPSGVVWLFGIYIGIYGIASTRYENRVDVIENRANTMIALLGRLPRKVALEQFAQTQNMPCPKKPNLFWPPTTLESFIKNNSRHDGTVEALKNIFFSMKNDLSGMNLSGVDLSSVDLSKGKFTHTNLKNADFTSAELTNADLSFTNMQGALLNNANLNSANLYDAKGLQTIDFHEVHINDETKLPTYIPPIKRMNLSNKLRDLENDHGGNIVKLPFKAIRNVSLSVQRSQSVGDFREIPVFIKGEKHTGGFTYHDEFWWSTFIEFDVSEVYEVVIKGEQLKREYYEGFDWVLEYNPGSEAGDFVTYMDTIRNGQFTEEYRVDEYDDGLLRHGVKTLSINDIELDYDVITDSPNEIKLRIHRMEGLYLGLKFHGGPDENFDTFCRETILIFANAADHEIQKACEDKALILMNVPRFRKKHVIDTLSASEDVSVYESDKIHAHASAKPEA